MSLFPATHTSASSSPNNWLLTNTGGRHFIAHKSTKQTTFEFSWHPAGPHLQLVFGVLNQVCFSVWVHADQYDIIMGDVEERTSLMWKDLWWIRTHSLTVDTWCFKADIYEPPQTGFDFIQHVTQFLLLIDLNIFGPFGIYYPSCGKTWTFPVGAKPL